MRSWTQALLRLLAATMIAAGAGCAQDTTPEGSRSSRIELGQTLQWEAVDGAVEYRVQVWDGVRLLFEEVRSATSLEPTPAMRRSLAGASTAELQVRAIGEGGRQIGPVQRRDLGPPG